MRQVDSSDLEFCATTLQMNGPNVLRLICLAR
jgi:hypothetical protein